MPFDFHNRDRLSHLTGELRELRYRELREIGGLRWYEEVNGKRTEGFQIVEKGFRFQGWDAYYWLCTQIQLPLEWAASPQTRGQVVALFDFGVPTGTGNNSHFESLLYANGRPYQGVDGNHQEVFLDGNELGGDISLEFRLWSGLSGGGRPKDMAMELVRADLGILDRAADRFYYLAKTALDAYDVLEENNEYKPWLLNMLVQAFALVDYTEPGSQSFYESTAKGVSYLEEVLDGRGKPDVSVTLLGHTHIDVAWLWRLCHTREKAARSFSTVNRLMERYEGYQFLQTQAQLYDFIREDQPEIYEAMKKRAAEGRWEASGSMWVECDCNLVSGESLIRQILMGKNFFKKEFGCDNDFLWLPDVFGYSAALPQILKKSGINTFMTTKISWNDTNRLPYDTFLWRGIDGTQVTAHFITTPDPEPDSDSYTYNGDTGPMAVKGVWDNYRNKELNRDLIISYGYGDGGGGPNRDMLETLLCINRMPGIPSVRTETAGAYFQRLNKTLEENPYHGFLPVWDGELYLEFHRGTYTSQAYNKKMNRRMEYALRRIELLSFLADRLCGLPYAGETLEKVWKTVLCHQFHDILPGSAIREVYEDSHRAYGEAEALLNQVEEAAGAKLYRDREGAYTAFNHSGWKRDCFVLVKGGGRLSFTDGQGRPLSSWRDGGDARVMLKGLLPFSFTVFYGRERGGAAGLSEDRQDQPPAGQNGPGEAESRHYRVAWNGQGQLTRIFDKAADRDLLPPGGRANVFQIMEDKPRCFDAWELEATVDWKLWEITDCTGITVKKQEAVTAVTFHFHYHHSRIIQTMYLYEEKRRIDFRTNVLWQERRKLLKVAFPLAIRSDKARFDIQNGNLTRNVTRNTTWDMARFETVVHKWLDFEETGYGAALLNDCKYGCDVKDSVVRLTLLKSAMEPDYEADQGEHQFTYAILPHEKPWYEAGIEEEAFDLNDPVTANPGVFCQGGGSFFTFSKENIMIDTVKKCENTREWILRFHETTGARGRISVESPFFGNGYCECSLMEEPLEERKQAPADMLLLPYEIKTILF